MRKIVVGVGLLLLGFGLSVTASRAADDKKAKPAVDEDKGVQQLTIYNGSTRLVYYSGKGLSASDQEKMQELSDAENELAMAEAKKADADNPAVQMPRVLFGGPYYGAPYPYSPLWGLPDYGASYLGGWVGFLSGNPAPWSPLLGYGYGLPYAGFGYGAYAAPYAALPYASPQVIVMNSGGDKESKGPSPEERVAQARKRLDRVSRMVARSPGLRKQMKDSGIRLVADEDEANGPMVVVTMKNGETLYGTKMAKSDDKDWVVIDTPNGKTTIRKNSIDTIQEMNAPKKP
jgi:hypothetical protein